MLSEAKTALRITTDAYDAEIALLLSAAAKDLEVAGVVIPGTVVFLIDPDEGVTDESDMTDALVMRVMITYTRMHFGSPEDYERLAESYELQKTMLMHADGYTSYSEG